MLRLRASVLGLLLSSACLPSVGPRVDAGGDPNLDAGVPDAGAMDGGATDAGCSSALDCPTGVCAASQCVAPASVCPAAFAGCSTFTDLTAASAVRVIGFPSTNDTYTPACARIRYGQSVTFEGGSFSSHPLTQACGPIAQVLTASAGTTFSVTFDRALGVFGFYCASHGSAAGGGMAGAIEVVR